MTIFYKERKRTMLQFHSKKLSNEKVGYDDMFMFDRFHFIPEEHDIYIDDFGIVSIVQRHSNNWTILEEASSDFQFGDYDTVYLVRRFEFELEDGTVISKKVKIQEYRLYEDKGIRQWIRQELIDFEPFD